MTTSRELVTLGFDYPQDKWDSNLSKLKELISQTSDDAVICAPELALTNFSFDLLEEAALFSTTAIEALKKIVGERIFCTTVIAKEDGNYYNRALVLHKGKIIHSQDKVKLFKFGEEDKHYTPGDIQKVKIIEIDGLRVAILICFEIRFIELWQKIQGADIIFVPSLWGKLRKSQYEAITTALAIINQAFVIASNSTQEDMAASSGIITPFGVAYRDDSKELISLKADLREIKKMRRYMDIGLS